MAKRSIWAGDEENKPKARQTYADDTVGRLHSGYSETNEKGNLVPVALSEWRFSTGEKTVADAVAQLFGGTPVENEESTSENFIDVFTSKSRIPVVIEADGIDWDMKLWWNNKLKHHCDGFDFLSHKDEDMIGQPCGCPTLFDERKAAAKEGDAPNPAQTVTFSLADDPELGRFKFQTGSWTLFKVIHEAEDDLERIGQGGAVLAYLELELVEYTPKKGPMRNKLVSYYKPVINVVKSYDAAIAE
ncbi:hypothetical protein HXS80_15940 [Streptomyces sp. CB04723]|uniref:recombination directionality factor n=1 Tax=Streptomyces TaxID=1883 RepID=UPI0015C45D64|nr:hypothetical protein [Streptomyces sp. CB04723]QLG33019.1 hypothetical protein HXS80_15940 [Streptomyces sp. CB04723]